MVSAYAGRCRQGAAEKRFLINQLHRLEGMAEESSAIGMNREPMSRLSPALQLIQKRCDGKLTVRELADVCAMSPTYFAESFRRVFGRSPYQYLQQYRLSLACVELEATKYTVQAIAEKHGFPTLSCFVRAFRKQYGVPPRRWAKDAANLSLTISSSLSQTISIKFTTKVTG